MSEVQETDVGRLTAADIRLLAQTAPSSKNKNQWADSRFARWIATPLSMTVAVPHQATMSAMTLLAFEKCIPATVYENRFQRHKNGTRMPHANCVKLVKENDHPALESAYLHLTEVEETRCDLVVLLPPPLLSDEYSEQHHTLRCL